jgi:hypothetical protein
MARKRVTYTDVSIIYGTGRAHRRIPLPTALVDRPAVEKIKSSFARTDLRLSGPASSDE